MIKSIIFTGFFILYLCPYIYPDNSFYYASGDNLFPLQSSGITLTYEKLEFKKVNDAVMVKAYFELSNNYLEQDILIGFETPPEHIIYAANTNKSGVTDMCVSNADGIEDFKVKVNDENVKYNLKIGKDTNPVVYSFNAKFKNGLNKITHSYLLKGWAKESYFLYQYRLSTGKKWAGSLINKLDIVVDMGSNALFSLPVYIDNSTNVIKWYIEGTGESAVNNKDYSYDEYSGNNSKGINYFNIQYGSVKTTVYDLKADYDLKLIYYNNEYAKYAAPQLLISPPFNILYSKALSLYQMKKYDEAVKLYEQALKIGSAAELYYDYGNCLSYLSNRIVDSIKAYQLSIDDGFTKKHLAYYNMACSYSKMGKINEAYTSLKSAIDNGYNYYDYAEKDPDLANLRKDPGWDSWWQSVK